MLNIEKTLHEIIRDLPEAKQVSDMYARGLLTPEDTLTEIANVIKTERRESK